MNSIDVPAAGTWGPLTYELGKATSPVAAFFKKRYPNTRAVQQRYRDGVGSIVIGSGGAHPATLGTAFDWAVRFLLHPQPCPDLAIQGVLRFPPLGQAAIDLALRLGIATGDNGRLGMDNFAGPAAGATIDRELLLRGCWALALLTEVFRIGGVHPGSALAQLNPRKISADDLLTIATPVHLAELGELYDLAIVKLVPPLSQRRGQWALGPTFDGSRLMNADADFIAAGLLAEIKTSLGDRNADGTRRASLEGSTLYQMIGYALLDFTDRYTVDTLGLYSARYGHLALWPLRDLLAELSGHAIDLAAERDALRAVLLRQAV